MVTFAVLALVVGILWLAASRGMLWSTRRRRHRRGWFAGYRGDGEGRLAVC